MRIAIGTDEKSKNIVTVVDIDNPNSKGEVAHFLAELELIKQRLLNLWDEVADWLE